MTSDEDIPVVDAEPVNESEDHEGEGGDKTAAASNNWAGTLVHSFGHGLIQAPIDGVREVVNTLAGSKVVPKVQIVEPPERHEVTTPQWQAGKIGAGAGLLAAGLVISRLIFRR
ncbi:MAG: hypothetical protein IPM23_18940 [Candidatus Melainabacteria bacterium]|nr:hypothetical protein [Candidatus Melainabacteria bacterium]